MLGGVADDRDDHCGDEELRQARLVGEDVERADEDLRDERGDDGREARTTRANRNDQAAISSSLAMHRRVPAQRVPRHAT